MTLTTIEPFTIIGLSIRTSNQDGQAAQDIPALWARFFSENVMAAIPDKIDDTLYCIYTDYEGDYTKPYTTLLGCKVASLTHLPEGLSGKVFEGGTYTTFTAKGKLADGIVFNEWTAIWNSDIARAYTADIEIYGEKAKDADNAEIDILIAVL